MLAANRLVDEVPLVSKQNFESEIRKLPLSGAFMKKMCFMIMRIMPSICAKHLILKRRIPIIHCFKPKKMLLQFANNYEFGALGNGFKGKIAGNSFRYPPSQAARRNRKIFSAHC